MIVFEDVAKRYAGGYTALAGVSFEIRHGELVVLSGHSGAGKSTLFKLIPVIERPTAGRVLINGQDVSHLPKTAIPYLRRNLGLVLQESRLLFDRTVYDNVMLPLVITGHPPRDAVKRVAAALERVGLDGRGKEMPAGLSGGEQQRVAIARAIVNDPAIVIADEPTGNLDPETSWDIMDIFERINRAGTTIVMATHDRNIVDTMKRRVIAIEDGQVVRDEARGGYGYEA